MDRKKKAAEPTLRTLLDRVESGFDRLESGFDRLENRMNGLDHRMGRLDNRMDRLDSRMDRLDVRVDGQGLVLEDMRSQNRATIEAVEATRVELGQRIDGLRDETYARLGLLEAAIQHRQV